MNPSRRSFKRFVLPLAGAAVFVLLAASAAYWHAGVGVIRAEDAQTTGDLAPVNAQVAGTVLEVRAAEHQYVKAGTVLVELDPTVYRLALARAQARMIAARAQAQEALAALATQERAVSTEIRAALDKLGSTPRLARQTQVPAQIYDQGAAARIEVARKQLAAAQAQVLRAARAQLIAAQDTLNRDKGLLAEGLIAVQEVNTDTAVYDAARARVAAAESEFRQAQVQPPSTNMTRPYAASPRRPIEQGSSAEIERAQAQVAAAQVEARTAQAEVNTAQQKIDRDKALLAEGAIPAQQLNTDAAAYDTAHARADAAEAAVRQAQAQLAAAQAARQHEETFRRGVALSTRGRASAADGLARQAEVGIAVARQRAQELAAAQARVVDAEGDIRTAQVNLSRTVIRAPVDGWVTHSIAKPGQAVQPDRPLMSLAIPGHTWVVAHIRETQLGAVRVGDPVRLKIDTVPGLIHGHVMSIGKVTGSFAAFPQDGASGRNAARAVRLTPIRIALDAGDAEQAPAGLPAEVLIDTRHWGPNSAAAEVYVPPEPLAADRNASGASPNLSPVASGVSQGALQAQQQQIGRRQRLAQIAEQEHRVFAQLEAESAQIRAIILRSASGQYRGQVPTLRGDALLWPVPGEVTSGYGWRIHPIFQTPEFHTGIDIAASQGTPIQAAADGTVIFTGMMPANGMLVIVDHGNGLSTTYSHLSSYAVHVGDRIRRGQIIGMIGSTGWSTGPHLFFEVRENGQPVDPLGP